MRHDQRPKKKVKVMSKILKSMVRLFIFWYIEQQIQKEFVRVPRRFTRVISFDIVQCRAFQIYFVLRLEIYLLQTSRSHRRPSMSLCVNIIAYTVRIILDDTTRGQA